MPQLLTAEANTVARWCPCGQPAGDNLCDDCRRDELRERQLDALDLELAELLEGK